MNDWLHQMQCIRQERIAASDAQILQSFSRLPLLERQLVPKSKGQHTHPAKTRARTAAPYVRMFALGLAGFLILGWLAIVATIPPGLLDESSFEPNPLKSSQASRITIIRPEYKPVLNISVQAGAQQSCTSIKWQEGGTTRIKYECEVR
jgi:hypothetical protein